MYFRIRNKILFRQYDEYGYITDNSMFGYRMLNDSSKILGEKYISQSGAIILSTLSQKPQHIDKIIEKLLNIFVGVDYDELKQDTVEFLLQFANEGYLSCGDTTNECNTCDESAQLREENKRKVGSAIRVENCSKSIFSPTDFLRSIHIEITSECNERCVHCYIPHEYKIKSIDSSLFYKIIEEGRILNIINVTLSGGEPLLHKDILNFLSKCREQNLSVNILTNLTLLTDEIIVEMKKIRCFQFKLLYIL